MKKIIFGTLILFFILAGIGALLAIANNRLRERGDNQTENTAISNGQAETAVTVDKCEEVYKGLIAKYGENYDSCYEDAQINESDCSKPDGLSDSYKENLNILVILDSSGSMNESISGGKKMDIAKRVIKNFVGSLPERAWVGLMVYGHKGSNAASSKAVSCVGIDMVYPMSMLDKAKFAEAVDSFQPTGYTPIAGSLNKAKEILASKDPEKTTNIIYLVSDGIETCDGDPAAAAKELKDLKVQTMVNIVGFAVDGSAQAQLKSAATAGGGEYYTANSADEIERVFNDRSKFYSEVSRYFNCEYSDASKTFNAKYSNASKVFNCLYGKASKEFNNVYDEASRLYNSKEIDGDCSNKIQKAASEKSNRIQRAASEEHSKQTSEAGKEHTQRTSEAIKFYDENFYKK